MRSLPARSRSPAQEARYHDLRGHYEGVHEQRDISEVRDGQWAAPPLTLKLPSGAGEDSYNILPALAGQTLDHPIREATVLHGGDGKFAIRQGNWVLIDAPTGDGNGKRGEPNWLKRERGYQPNSSAGELYDLRADLAQRRNLYAEQPEVVRRLQALLAKYKTEGRSAPARR